MDKKIIGLASADWHFYDWKQFNENEERIFITIHFMFDLFLRAQSLRVPIFFPGDLFHTPKSITTKTLCLFNSTMRGFIREFNGVKIYGISGNHEIDGKYSLFQAACDAFPEVFECLDNKVLEINGYSIIGIPYIRRNIGLVDKIKEFAKIGGNKILLLHTELYGAPDPSGYIPEPQNLPRQLNALFKDFNLVLAGHVHKFTRVEKNVYMVGAPNQQRKSDAGCDMGYLEIYDDFSVKQVIYKSPKFRFYQEGEEHERTLDFWIEIPKPKKIKKHSEAEFKSTMDKTEMAKRYAEEKGIKSSRKIRALIDILNKTDE